MLVPADDHKGLGVKSPRGPFVIWPTRNCAQLGALAGEEAGLPGKPHRPRDASVTGPLTATTGPIGHAHARSWRHLRCICRPRSIIVGADWRSRSVSVAILGRYVRPRPMSVAVPGRDVRPWSISVPRRPVWGWSVFVWVSGRHVSPWSISVVIAGVYICGRSASLRIGRYARG